MEENKDEYLKKKLHIKDRFIRRLETEKRQLEIDNNSLQLRLKNVEYQLSNLMRTQRKGADLQHDNTRLDGNIRPQSLTSGILSPRLIPFPSFKTSTLEENTKDLNQNSDIENGQLLNENLEFTLEISYLKARLKSSETAIAVAERKIESLEEKLKQAEKLLGQPMRETVLEQVKFPRTPCPSHADSSVQETLPAKAEYNGMVSCNIMTCLDRILKAVLLLDEKITCYQKS